MTFPRCEPSETISAMQRLARQWQMQRVPVSFVPTMGCLHSGHLSLIQCARRYRPARQGRRQRLCQPHPIWPSRRLRQLPAQSLPRQETVLAGGRRCALCALGRGNVPAAFSTWVVEESLTRGMEGASRPTHFRGVATVVAKLFHIVLPTAAVFGAKDFQQAALIQKMTRELNFPIKIVVSPIVRERDGLAFSSRNRYLTKAQRSRATVTLACHSTGQGFPRRPAHPCRAPEGRIARLGGSGERRPSGLHRVLRSANPRARRASQQGNPYCLGRFHRPHTPHQ